MKTDINKWVNLKSCPLSSNDFAEKCRQKLSDTGVLLIPLFLLPEALNQSLVDLDGSYTYLVSTKDGLGFAKEKWSFKPLVLMERKDIIALASEETALRQVFPEEIDRLEPQENEVMTWKI